MGLQITQKMGNECLLGQCWIWYLFIAAGILIMIFKVIIPLIKMKKKTSDNHTNGKL